MSDAWTGDLGRLENLSLLVTSRWIWQWRNLLTTQCNAWNQWNKTALLLREKRKKSNKIQRPIKETYNNSNDRAPEVSVRPLNSICLTKAKVRCSVGSRHHKPLIGKGCCWRKGNCSFWSTRISLYSVTDQAIFYWYCRGKKKKKVKIPSFPSLSEEQFSTRFSAGERHFLMFTAFILVPRPTSLLLNWNRGRCLVGLRRWSMKLIISVRLWVQEGAEMYLRCRICLYDMVLILAGGL